jgi:hypothetical protein
MDRLHDDQFPLLAGAGFPGCEPARCGSNATQAMMIAARIAVA